MENKTFNKLKEKLINTEQQNSCWYPKKGTAFSRVYYVLDATQKTSTLRQAIYQTYHNLERVPRYLIPTCGNVNCCNPRHLKACDSMEEMLRSILEYKKEGHRCESESGLQDSFME